MRWVFYLDKKGLWHWKRKAPNGRVIEISEQTFENLELCKSNAREIGWNEHSNTSFHHAHLQDPDT